MFGAIAIHYSLFLHSTLCKLKAAAGKWWRLLSWNIAAMKLPGAQSLVTSRPPKVEIWSINLSCSRRCQFLPLNILGLFAIFWGNGSLGRKLHQNFFRYDDDFSLKIVFLCKPQTKYSLIAVKEHIHLQIMHWDVSDDLESLSIWKGLVPL